MFLFQNDPTEYPETRAVDKNSIQIWAVGGRLPVTMPQYADCVIVAMPIAYQMPVDNETSFPDTHVPTKKRCQKAVQRTKAYQDQIIAISKTNEALAEIPSFISVTGGNDLEQRLRGIDALEFTKASGMCVRLFFCIYSTKMKQDPLILRGSTSQTSDYL